MKGIKALLILPFVALALIAIVSSVSAYSIDDGTVVCINGDTWWNYTVTCDSSDPHAISHWIVFWCNETAVNGVRVNTTGDMVILPECPDGESSDACWEYKTDIEPDPTTGLQGIKIDNYGVEEGNSVNVTIILDGCSYDESCIVEYAIKYDAAVFRGYDLCGPLAGSACDPWIPEFSTIAIPVAAILGLLFFFNHRKKRGE